MQNEMITAINDAIGAHGAWKMRLRAAIARGNGDVTSATACKDDQCPFGKWLYSSALSPEMKAGVPYGVIRRLHAEFHQSAGSVLAYVERKDGAAANRVLEGEFADRSEKLVRALTKWKGEMTTRRWAA